MPINAKNKPGCPCCQCECADGTLYPKFTRIKVTISGLKSSYTWKSGKVEASGGTIATSTFTGLDDINGTHFFDIDHTPENCVDEEAYPISPTIALFEVSREWEEVTYDGDCDVVGTLSGIETAYFAITIFKDSPTFFSIGAGMKPEETNYETTFSVDACQELACENDFDATVSAGTENADGAPCSDGQFVVRYCDTSGAPGLYKACDGGTYCGNTVATGGYTDDAGATILAEITN